MPLLEEANGPVEIWKGAGTAPDLIDALESLPGVIFSMCSSASVTEMPFLIFINVNNFWSLSIIARAFDRRYSGTSRVYTVSIETSDSTSANGVFPTMKIMISPDRQYLSMDEFNSDMKQLKENIEYWQKPEFDRHFVKSKFNISI